jgi:DNA-directed RNA polymerase specialized sigma24 family protein
VIDDYYIKEIRKLAGMYYVRVHGVVDVDDLVQDGILRAMAAADVCSTRGYVITAARNAMLDTIRREMRHITRIVSVDPTVDPTGSDAETETD